MLGVTLWYNCYVEIKETSNIPWDLDKQPLIDGSVKAICTLIDTYEQAKPGETIIDCALSDSISFRVMRSHADQDDPDSTSLLLNIFHGKTEAAQIELRYLHRAGIWCIPDRHTRSGYEGKGIFSALLAAGEHFFRAFAEQNGAHTVELNTGQPKVLEIFEHKGYSVRKGQEDKGELIRHPDQHPNIVVQNAWSVPHPKSGEQSLLDDRDPYVFFRSVTEKEEHPKTTDAVRVTLEKRFHRASQTIANKTGDTRTSIDSLRLPN